MKPPETLTEFNKRRAKEKEGSNPPARLIQLGGKPIDLEAMVERIAKNQAETPTYACLECFDTGFVITDRPGPGKVYGKAKQTITYSHRCACKSNTYKSIRAKPKGDLPI